MKIVKEETIVRVEEILEELEELTKEAWNLPLTGGKGLINVERVRDLISEIRDELPNELRQAKAIIADRSQIISEAKEEAETIVSAAEKKAKYMVERDEIVKQAQKMAEEVVLAAKMKARDMKQATNEYIDDIIKHTDETLTGAVADLRKTRQNLKNGAQ